MKRLTAQAAMLLCLSMALMRDVRAQEIAGYWQGTQRIGVGEYRVLLHVSEAKKGERAASIDFIDMGGKFIPVTAISVTESRLLFRIDSIKASYEGIINADASVISGVWKQPSFEAPLSFRRGAPPKEPSAKRPSDIDGYWTGTVKYDPNPRCDPHFSEVRYSFHITNTVDGLTATFNIPDNDTRGWPATSVTREDALLSVEMKQLAGRFQGTLNKEKTVIGTWTQDGRSYPLTLARSQNLPKPVLTPGCAIDGMPRS
jgi:uncharacterized protein